VDRALIANAEMIGLLQDIHGLPHHRRPGSYQREQEMREPKPIDVNRNEAEEPTRKVRQVV